MQRLTEGNKFEQGDPFDILFQFLYFGSMYCFNLIAHHVYIIKILLVFKINLILSLWDGIYFIMSVLT